MGRWFMYEISPGAYGLKGVDNVLCNFPGVLTFQRMPEMDVVEILLHCEMHPDLFPARVAIKTNQEVRLTRIT